MKPLATFLAIVGLFSFICLILSNPPSIFWYIAFPLVVAAVVFFLITQLRPAKEGEIDKRKWVITGAIAGMVGPLLAFSPFAGYMRLALWPFSIFLLDSDFLSPILGRLLLICTIILNIGFFALLGLFLGTIVHGISRFIKSS